MSLASVAVDRDAIVVIGAPDPKPVFIDDGASILETISLVTDDNVGGEAVA